MKRNVIFTVLLSVALYANAQEYSIKGRFSNGWIAVENEGLFVGDALTFRIANNFEEPVFQSVVWRLEGLDWDSTYVLLLPESHENTFYFNLSLDKLENAGIDKFQGLPGYLGDRNETYYQARVVCVGKTDRNVDINKEFPLRLCFLPKKPEIEVTGYSLTEKYVQLRYTTERTDNLKLQDHIYRWGHKYGGGEGIIWEIPLQNESYIHYYNPYYLGSEYREQFLYLDAQNIFGAVYSDSIRIHELATSIEDVPDNAGLLIYPNPAHDYIFLRDSKIENIETLSFIDVSGKTVKKINGLKTEKINISDIAEGIYVLKVQYRNNHKNKILKLIKN